jgi:hypothetical protein
LWPCRFAIEAEVAADNREGFGILGQALGLELLARELLPGEMFGVTDDGLVTMGNTEQWWVRDWRAVRGATGTGADDSVGEGKAP